MTKSSRLNVEKIDSEVVSLRLPEEILNSKFTNNKSSDKKLKYFLSFLINLSSTRESQLNGYCYACDSDVANAIGCSKSYIEMYASKLVELGLLKKYERGSFQKRLSTRYWLSDKLFPKVNFIEDEKCTSEKCTEEKKCTIENCTETEKCTSEKCTDEKCTEELSYNSKKCTSTEKVYHNITKYNITKSNIIEYNIINNNKINLIDNNINNKNIDINLINLIFKDKESVTAVELFEKVCEQYNEIHNLQLEIEELKDSLQQVTSTNQELVQKIIEYSSTHVEEKKEEQEQQDSSTDFDFTTVQAPINYETSENWGKPGSMFDEEEEQDSSTSEYEETVQVLPF